MKLGALLLALALPLAAQGASAQTATAPTSIPFPDLSLLEPTVATALGDAQRQLSERIQERGATPPDIAQAYGDLGLLYHAHSLREPAEACYRNAARIAPQDFRWLHLLGTLLKDGGRLDEALAAFRQALALQPADAPAMVYLAEILRLQGETGAAEALLRTALEQHPSFTAAKALLGQTALDRRDFAAAARLLEQALAEAPAANRLHYMLATAYRGLGDTARAQEHLAKAGQVGVAPPDPLLAEVQSLRAGERLFLMRGKTAFDRGRFAEAAEEFRRALSTKPDSLEARINLAASLARLGDTNAAVSQLRDAVRQAPENPTAHFNLGSLLLSGGNPAEALEHLGAAVRLRPEDAEARRLLARTLRDAGRLDEARTQYAEAVRANPADETAWMGEAETLVRLERYREALARLEEGLGALPSSMLLARGLVRLLAACPDRSLRNGARALEFAAALRQAAPTPDHAELQALALAELGRCAEAVQWQRIALAEARETGLTAKLPGLSAALARYESGACQP